MTSAAASTVSRRTVGDVITCGSYNVAQMKVSRVWHEPMQWLETRLSARVKRELRAEQKNALRQVEEAQSDLRSLVKEMRTELAKLRKEMQRSKGPSARKRPQRDTKRGKSIPLTAAQLPQVVRADAGRASELPRESILQLDACPFCGCRESTLVCEYNRLLVLDNGLDEAAKLYNHSLCHGCGVVYARTRPVGPRYAYIVDRFEISLGRAQESGRTGKVVTVSAPLSDEERRTLRDRIARGVFVSQHEHPAKDSYLPQLMRDRMLNSIHIELLGSLLSPHKPRVLELRPRVGSIGGALKRLYGADVYAMPLFDVQGFIVEEAYGIPAAHQMDYDHFSIPYEGSFDLVIANHVLTHALRPGELLATIRKRLTPGGHVYLYNEQDESDYIQLGPSIINTMNVFHMQAYSVDSMARAFAASGFEPVFIVRDGYRLIALARAAGGKVDWTPMSEKERATRTAAYRRARDYAILKLPDEARAVFRDEWEEIVKRACEAGIAAFDEGGTLRLTPVPDRHRGDAI